MSKKTQATIITGTLWLAATGFLFLGLRTFIFPSSAAIFYGAPEAEPAALMFVQAYGARNIAISFAVIWLLAGREYTALPRLLFPVALIATLDAWIVYDSVGVGFAKHIVYTAVILTLGVLALRRRGLSRSATG